MRFSKHFISLIVRLCIYSRVTVCIHTQSCPVSIKILILVGLPCIIPRILTFKYEHDLAGFFGILYLKPVKPRSYFNISFQGEEIDAKCNLCMEISHNLTKTHGFQNASSPLLYIIVQSHFAYTLSCPISIKIQRSVCHASFRKYSHSR